MKMFPMKGGPDIPWCLAEVIYAIYKELLTEPETLEAIVNQGGFHWEEVPDMYNDIKTGRGGGALRHIIKTAEEKHYPKNEHPEDEREG